MKRFLTLLTISTLIISGCSDDNETSPAINNPTTYSFERDGESTVSFSGQTTRIMMAEELISGLKNFDNSEVTLLEMFRNETEGGGDANPFTNVDLNADTKNIKSKVATSKDFFGTNTVVSNEIKADFESWINEQVNEVFPNESVIATPGIAGQIADGSSVRYINAQGLELNQLFAKSLIGALMTDQALNNYLGTTVLDENDNRTTNNSKLLEEGKNYTTMEHKWDEAYGYVYGTSTDKSNPNATIGSDDSFLNKYIGTVNESSLYPGIADDIFNAFKLGRASIVAGDYTTRDAQVQIIREKISEVIAVRAVYYLQAGKNALPSDRNNYAAYGSAFHDLSEGFGFVYSLQFTRIPGTDSPYFTKAEVDAMIDDLLNSGDNGLWDVETSVLDAVSSEIAAKFGFTVVQAAL